MGLHAFGREILKSVWVPTLGGEEPTVAELQMVGAISSGEGGYGRAVYKLLDISPGENYGHVLSTVNDSNNWGATQKKAKAPECDVNSFPATDSSPRLVSPQNPKGYYNACYHRHATPQDGAISYLRTLMIARPTVRTAVRSGDANQVAREMFRTHYFEGFSKDPEKNIRAYAGRIRGAAERIARELGESLAITGGTSESFPESDSPWWQGHDIGTPGQSAESSGSSKGSGIVAIGLMVAAGYLFLRKRRS